MIVSICFNLLNKLLGGSLPPFGSAGVVIEQDDHYLMVELPRGRLVFPGGFMKWHETPEQTARREGYEETGLDLRIGQLINIYHRSSTSLFRMSNICFVYHAEVVGGELRKNIEGKPQWLTEDEIRAHFGEHTQQVLEDYLRYRQLHHDVTAQDRLREDDPPPAEVRRSRYAPALSPLFFKP
jgi:ADP-ribose pyrophosphatase YjhB (NUDIX family)